jgi:hypothetical protein
MVSSFTFDASQIQRGLVQFDGRTHEYLLAISDYHAQRAQAEMRVNAPWTDRTGNARNGLFATPFGSRGTGVRGRSASGRFTSGGASYGIDLYHSVPYGIWLERAHAGRYAAIVPVLSSEGHKFMASVAAMFAAIAG